MSRTYFKINTQDIRFWITLLFVVRLYGIWFPPLEVGHNWRQTTVTMVARNFLEVSNNIFYPRIDIAGNLSGITGMEFPLLNYIIYLMSELLGYQHWYGRLINLVVSSFGLWYFYLLVQKFFADKVAFFSTIILGVSLWFSFSRKIMPDTFSMSMMMMALYYGTSYLYDARRGRPMLDLLLYALLVMLGVLSKLPSGYILIVLILPFLDKNISVSKKALIAVISGLALIPVLYWYFDWVPFLVKRFDFWHFYMGQTLSEGATELLTHLNKTLSRFYESALMYLGFITFVVGLIMTLKHKKTRLLYTFLLSLAAFSVIMVKGGFAFHHHNYYVLPFVPVMALVAGYGVAQVPQTRIAILLLSLIAIENVIGQSSDFIIKEKEKALLNLESDLDSLSHRTDLIMINSGEYPTPMYFAHRKGWLGGDSILQEKHYIQKLEKKGLKYIVILKRTFGTDLILPDYRQLLNNKDYKIYAIKSDSVNNKKNQAK